MKKSLKNIQKIKQLAKIKWIINIIAFPIMISLLILSTILLLKITSTHKISIFAIIIFVFFVILSLFLSIENLVLSIFLIINSASIYVSYTYKNKEIKLAEQIKTFRNSVLIYSILSIFFGLGLIVDPIIWIMSKTKIRFLKEKIKEQTRNKIQKLTTF